LEVETEFSDPEKEAELKSLVWFGSTTRKLRWQAQRPSLYVSPDALDRKLFNAKG
jgi:hypothetical protein